MSKKKWVIISLMIYVLNYISITLVLISSTIERVNKADLLRGILHDFESGFHLAVVSWIMSMISIIWILLAKTLYKKLKEKMPVAISIFVLALLYFLTIVVWLNSFEILETDDGFALFLFGIAFYCKLFLYHLIFLGYTIIKKVKEKKRTTNDN